MASITAVLFLKRTCVLSYPPQRKSIIELSSPLMPSDFQLVTMICGNRVLCVMQQLASAIQLAALQSAVISVPPHCCYVHP